MSRKISWTRRAEANKSLLITLGVVAFMAVGFWGYRIMTGEKPAPAVASSDPVSFYCYDCKKTFEVAPDQAAGMQAVDGKFECPTCKKRNAIKGYGPSARMPQNP
ncbi:MAG: hypothetical protein IT450_00925 [Phycisphaerales bacterium]|nr:hypothetical protein [Phycisphaerales bacterium]